MGPTRKNKKEWDKGFLGALMSYPTLSLLYWTLCVLLVKRTTSKIPARVIMRL